MSPVAVPIHLVTDEIFAPDHSNFKKSGNAGLVFDQNDIERVALYCRIQYWFLVMLVSNQTNSSICGNIHSPAKELKYGLPRKVEVAMLYIVHV